ASAPREILVGEDEVERLTLEQVDRRVDIVDGGRCRAECAETHQEYTAEARTVLDDEDAWNDGHGLAPFDGVEPDSRCAACDEREAGLSVCSERDAIEEAAGVVGDPH